MKYHPFSFVAVPENLVLLSAADLEIGMAILEAVVEITCHKTISVGKI